MVCVCARLSLDREMAGHHQFLPGIDWGDYSDDEDYATIADPVPPELRLAIRVVLSTLLFVSGHRGDVLLVEQKFDGMPRGLLMHNSTGWRMEPAAHNSSVDVLAAAVTAANHGDSISWWIVFTPSWATDAVVAILALYLLHIRSRPRSMRSMRVESCVVDLYHLSTAILGATFKVLLAHTLESGTSIPIWLLFSPVYASIVLHLLLCHGLPDALLFAQMSQREPSQQISAYERWLQMPLSRFDPMLLHWLPQLLLLRMSRMLLHLQGVEIPSVFGLVFPMFLLLGWAVCVAVTPFFVRAIQAVGPIIWGLLLLPKWSLLISWCFLSEAAVPDSWHVLLSLTTTTPLNGAIMLLLFVLGVALHNVWSTRRLLLLLCPGQVSLTTTLRPTQPLGMLACALLCLYIILALSFMRLAVWRLADWLNGDVAHTVADITRPYSASLDMMLLLPLAIFGLSLSVFGLDRCYVRMREEEEEARERATLPETPGALIRESSTYFKRASSDILLSLGIQSPSPAPAPAQEPPPASCCESTRRRLLHCCGCCTCCGCCAGVGAAAPSEAATQTPTDAAATTAGAATVESGANASVASSSSMADGGDEAPYGVAISIPDDGDDGDGDGDSSQCIICLDGPRDAVFLECGHGGVCHTCARKCATRDDRKCPLCRKRIHRVMKIGEVLPSPRGMKDMVVRVELL